MGLHPVGPLPASTYWRRRVAVLGTVLVLLWLALHALAGGGHGPVPSASPSAVPSSGPSRVSPSARATATARPTATAAPARGPVTCSDRDLRLSVASDVAQYPVGGTPRFVVTVREVGPASCRRDLGPLEVLVLSGPDRIWSSTDCAPAEGASVQVLAAGASLEATKIWDGRRSRPGCAGTRTTARAGVYTVRASIGTLVSGVSVFRLSGTG